MATYLVGKRSPELTSKRNALESVFMMASLLYPNLSTENVQRSQILITSFLLQRTARMEMLCSAFFQNVNDGN